MVWLIVVVAMVVMGAAAIAGTGRLGEMPEPVTDRPKPHFPDAAFGPEYLRELRLPVVLNGYATDQVDQLLSACAEGETEVSTVGLARFDVVRRGYAMDAVDELIDRLMSDATSATTAQTPAESSREHLNVRDNGSVRTTEEIEDAHGSNEAPNW